MPTICSVCLSGKVGGVIGETSVALLLIGAIYLLVKGYIDWRVPLGYIGTVAVSGLGVCRARGLFYR